MYKPRHRSCRTHPRGAAPPHLAFTKKHKKSESHKRNLTNEGLILFVSDPLLLEQRGLSPASCCVFPSVLLLLAAEVAKVEVKKCHPRGKEKNII